MPCETDIRQVAVASAMTRFHLLLMAVLCSFQVPRAHRYVHINTHD